MEDEKLDWKFFQGTVLKSFFETFFSSIKTRNDRFKTAVMINFLRPTLPCKSRSNDLEWISVIGFYVITTFINRQISLFDYLQIKSFTILAFGNYSNKARISLNTSKCSIIQTSLLCVMVLCLISWRNNYKYVKIYQHF